MTRLALAAALLLGACSQQTCPPPKATPAKPAAPQSSLWPDRATPIVMPRLAPQAAPESRKAVAVKAPKRVKPAPRRAAPKPKQVRAVALPKWCSRVPWFASQAQVERAAVGELKRPLTPKEQQQAAACIASKKG